MAITPIQQAMLALAYCADLNLSKGDGKNAPKDYDQAIREGLQVLNDQQKSRPPWQLAWGPALYSFSLPGVPYKREIDNVMFVASNSAHEYAVAIAGTDWTSLADWVLEDFLVRETEAWPYGGVLDPTPRVSFSMFLGLSILRAVVPSGDSFPGHGQKLLPFLASIAKEPPVTVYTTGHSLGGALSPTLALYLQDNRAKWDPGGTATVSPFAFAGPTPGNAAFASYFGRRFPEGMTRIWNGRDIVPHAWDVAHLEEIPTLYGEPPLPVVVDKVNRLVKSVRTRDYAPLDGSGPAFGEAPTPGPTPADLDAFLKEALYQHTQAYWTWGGIEGWKWPKPKSKPEI